MNPKYAHYRVDLPCDVCGTVFSKLKSKVAPHNYCSQSCSRKDHGRKITGKNHPNWRGGHIAGRGSNWDKIRVQALADDGFACRECGMREDDHLEKYGIGLHVHHIRPYRLSLDNSPQNLIVLCIPCHGLAEGTVTKSLTADEKLVMQARTEKDRVQGFHQDDYSRIYNDCPQCGKKKAKRAKTCRECRCANMRAASTYYTCPVCSGHMPNPRATRCWSCRVARRR